MFKIIDTFIVVDGLSFNYEPIYRKIYLLENNEYVMEKTSGITKISKEQVEKLKENWK